MEKKTYGMFSAAGDRLVYSLAKRIGKNPMTTTHHELKEMAQKGFEKIADKGHGEVWDTDVREQFAHALFVATNREVWL